MTAELLFQTADERARELAQDIVSAASPTGDLLLGGGHLDTCLFQTKPTILRRLASLLAERIPLSVDRLAGSELGAVALVTAVSLETGLPFVIVREAAQCHGAAEGRNTVGFIEGELHGGEHLLIVADVIGTGAGALRTADRIERAGGDGTAILAVIDRKQGGAENIAAAGYSIEALFERDGGRLVAGAATRPRGGLR
jgi:orotate phosphoribosyltransferase